MAEGMAEDHGSYDAEAIASNLSEKQVDILREFDEHEFRNSSEIRKGTGIGTTTVNNQLRRVTDDLVSQGIVLHTGEDYNATTPGDNHPSKYQITEKGRAILDVFRQREIEDSVDITKFDELRDEVERAEKERAKLRSEVKELRQEDERIEGRLDTLISKLENDMEQLVKKAMKRMD